MTRREAAAIVMLVCSLFFVGYVRVAGIDLTEGQILTQFWPWVLASVVFGAIAGLILYRERP